MAKRLTASEKWDDAWFRKLSPVNKCLWIYLLDRCDCAGVFEWDAGLASVYIGTDVTLDGMEGRVLQVSGEKYWIPKFIEFQYGCTVTELTDTSSIHRGVLKIVKKYGLVKHYESLTKPLPIPCQRKKDKDKIKDKDLVKVKEEKKKVAEFVSLTDSEIKALTTELGPDRAAKAVEILDNYKGSKGKKYASDYRAIRSWVIGELEKRERAGGVGRTRGEVLTDEKLKRQVERLTGRPYEPEAGDGDSADSGGS